MIEVDIMTTNIGLVIKLVVALFFGFLFYLSEEKNVPRR